MPMLMLPNGMRYSLHTGVPDMTRLRIANRFGLAGMMGAEDARFTGPARGPSVVLPLVRGHEGWFYRSDGRRVQTRYGMRGLGAGPAGTCGTGPGQIDCSKNTPSPYQAANGIIGFTVDGQPVWSSPAAEHAFNCSSPAGMYDPSCTPAQLAAPQASAPGTSASGAPLPGVAPNVVNPQLTSRTQGGGGQVCPAWGCGPAPVRSITQQQVSAATGQPNQSVPPQSPLTPLPTGTGASGGNPIINQPVATAVSGTGSNTGLLLAAAAVAALFIFGRK